MRNLTISELEIVSGGQETEQGTTTGGGGTTDGGNDGAGPQELPCQILREEYDSLTANPDDDFGQFMWDTFMDTIGGEARQVQTQTVTQQYIECLEEAAGIGN